MIQFEDELKEILARVEGAIAVSIMGFDGIAVAEVCQPESDVNMSDLTIEFGGPIKELRSLSQQKKLGDMESIMLKSKKHGLAIEMVNAEYFLGLFLEKSAIYGKAEYFLRRSCIRLRPEL